MRSTVAVNPPKCERNQAAPVANVDRIFACGDSVVTRVVYTATHAREFPGVPVTGAHVEVTGLDVFRFEDGRVVEHLHEADHEAMWEQLGVRLPPG